MPKCTKCGFIAKRVNAAFCGRCGSGLLQALPSRRISRLWLVGLSGLALLTLVIKMQTQGSASHEAPGASLPAGGRPLTTREYIGRVELIRGEWEASVKMIGRSLMSADIKQADMFTRRMHAAESDAYAIQIPPVNWLGWHVRWIASMNKVDEQFGVVMIGVREMNDAKVTQADANLKEALRDYKSVVDEKDRLAIAASSN